MHRLNVDIFGEDIVDNTNPSQTQYYNPQANASYYPRHANLPLHSQSTCIPQYLNYQPQQTPHLLHCIILNTPQIPMI
jgi:hypothetical protein